MKAAEDGRRYDARHPARGPRRFSHLIKYGSGFRYTQPAICVHCARSALMSDLNLAVIGNSAIAALVDRRARIVWCCFPRFDGDPIFCSLLEYADDPTGAGLFDIELTNLESAKQEYVRNTAILVTTLTDDARATVQITDLAPRFRHYGRLFRPTILVRRVAPLAGSPRLRIRARPRSDYGATPMGQIPGSNHIRYIPSTLSLRLTPRAPLTDVAAQMPS